jgi:predicted protein tyrosine phosphatase
MKYTIVGCITKYGIEQIRPFVESIDMSGFAGEKLMLVYDISQDTIEYLTNKGWLIVQSEPQQHIILQRFRDMYSLLHQYETDVIIWVDVKDIIFQKDPTEWLNKWMRRDILAFSESLKFGDEEWARLNAGTSFPMEWEWLQNEEIYCAGTIVGKKEAIRDLFIDIYRWSLTTSNPEQLSDQAAYNILIHMYQWKDKVQFVKQQEGFAAQLHLKLKKGDILPYTEELSTIDGNEIKNSKGELYTLVHQYDRNEELKQLIENKYK